ncbi:YetF domain-containing protein [Blastococcus sp. HT6-30]|uniref:DUF421 domain-containing protein n=1 Tax=Blastococcus sp. HT6-30 TaxID=3144843 RepID=UPI00321B1087
MSSVVFWFGGWEPIARIVVMATLGYLALVVLLRVSGKRTLARMNSFDFVITVAIGATFGRVLTARQVALAEAVTAFAMLVFLQFAATWLQVRSSRADRLLTAAPRLLYYRGRLLHDALRAERVTPTELEGVARLKGLGSLAEAEAVVMETDGRFSVVKRAQAGDGSALGSVREPDA